MTPGLDRYATSIATAIAPDDRAAGAVARHAAFAAAGIAPGAPMWVSVAHRHGRAVAAASGDCPLGVDLEPCGAVPPGLERIYLAPDERALLDRHDATVLWTLKEAAWKALALDPSTPFHALTLACDARGALTAVHGPAGRRAASAAVWRPWRGWTAGLVWLP